MNNTMQITVNLLEYSMEQEVCYMNNTMQITVDLLEYLMKQDVCYMNNTMYISVTYQSIQWSRTFVT